MPSYRVRALVLRKTKLGETDVIVTMLAESGTQVRAVAKGMRKPTSRFASRLEPFSVVDALLHTGRSLDVVTEVETFASHHVAREDFDRSAAGSVVVDVLDKLSTEGQDEERLFGLGCATLDALDRAPVESLPQLVTAFLVKAMAMHGLKPELHACASCACGAGGGDRFSQASGGVLCPECGERDPSALPFGEEGRALLVQMLGSTMAELAEEPADPTVLRACFDLVRGFVAYHTSTRLKALDFYAGVMR